MRKLESSDGVAIEPIVQALEVMVGADAIGRRESDDLPTRKARFFAWWRQHGAEWLRR